MSATRIIILALCLIGTQIPLCFILAAGVYILFERKGVDLVAYWFFTGHKSDKEW